PCPIIDTPEELQDIVKESGANPTHDGADSIFKGELAENLLELSKKWNKTSLPINKERLKS
ncbi:MAG: radical SAM protein, partial [Halanaerobiales bacterium]